MKKSFLILSLVLMTSASGVFAQNTPKQGAFSTEIQVNPFDQNGETFKLDGLKFRYFLTDKDALRLNLGFGITSNRHEDGDNYLKSQSGDFNIDLGYERHFKITGRLDLYAGGQLGFFNHFASAKTKIADVESIYTNMIPDAGNNRSADRAYYGLAASAFTGLDFYVYKGMYVGTELGFYVRSAKSHTAEMRIGDKSTHYDDVTTTTTSKFAIEPSIRLGWTF